MTSNDINQLINTTFNVADADARLVEADAAFLDTFLKLDAAGKADRWRSLDYGAKYRLVVRQIEALGYDWMPSTVEAQIAKYDAKYAVASDIAIPAVEAILVAAKEQSDLAQLHGDFAGAAQLNRVKVNLKRGAALSWCFGELLIQSVNNPGRVYCVGRTGCTCPNGQKGQSRCWHAALYDLLLQLQQTAADTADMEAEAAYEAVARAELGRRLCAARSVRMMQEAA